MRRRKAPQRRRALCSVLTRRPTPAAGEHDAGAWLELQQHRLLLVQIFHRAAQHVLQPHRPARAHQQLRTVGLLLRCGDLRLVRDLPRRHRRPLRGAVRRSGACAGCEAVCSVPVPLSTAATTKLRAAEADAPLLLLSRRALAPPPPLRLCRLAPSSRMCPRRPAPRSGGRSRTAPVTPPSLPPCVWGPRRAPPAAALPLLRP